MKKPLLAAGLAAGLLIALLVRLSAADRSNPASQPTSGITPPEGFVPNSKAAIKIAEAVIEPVYGMDTIRGERPYKARLVNGEWFVKGSLPTNVNVIAGTSEVHISKTNGCITFLFHWK
jgi:hypothetical protein